MTGKCLDTQRVAEFDAALGQVSRLTKQLETDFISKGITQGNNEARAGCQTALEAALAKIDVRALADTAAGKPRGPGRALDKDC
jgi:hypothetical protein